MISIIQMLGIPAAIKINSFLNDSLFKLLTLIFQSFQMIINMNSLLFPQSNDKQIEEAIKLYFLTISTITREKMKTQTQKQYLSYVELIDHFKSISKSIHLNIDERIFPIFLIRSCYNDL